LHLEPRHMSINVRRMSKAYMAIQRQCSCLLLIFHNTVLIRRTELRLHRAGALFGP
jgi:hypothetical protein